MISKFKHRITASRLLLFFKDLDMTLTEDYCSFELSRLLKEKGFNEECFALYNPDGVLIQSGIRLNNIQVGRVKGSYSAPTQQMAMKWLRENNIIITPQPEYFSCDRCESWGIDIWAFGNYEKLPGDFPKYEEAVEAALKYCLTKLI